MIHKKTILIDLDGVLNTYNGKYKKDFIPPVKDGAYQFLEKLSLNYDIKIFTTRNKKLANLWIKKNFLDKFVSEVTNTKLPAYLIIDDRCINFRGDFNNTLKEIENFKVWYYCQ